MHPVTGVITEIGVASWTKTCQKCVGKQAGVAPGPAVRNAAALPPALCTAAGATATVAATAEAFHGETPSDRTLALSGGDKLPACAVATVVAAAERAAAAAERAASVAAAERAATARTAAVVGGLGSNSASYGVGKPGTTRCSVEDELRQAGLLPALEAFTAGFENASKPRLNTLESITGNLHMLTLLAHPRPKAQGSASPEEVRTCLRCCCVSGTAAAGRSGRSREPATHRLWLWLIRLATVVDALSLTRRHLRRGRPARPTHSSARRRRRRQRY